MPSKCNDQREDREQCVLFSDVKLPGTKNLTENQIIRSHLNHGKGLLFYTCLLQLAYPSPTCSPGGPVSSYRNFRVLSLPSLREIAFENQLNFRSCITVRGRYGGWFQSRWVYTCLCTKLQSCKDDKVPSLKKFSQENWHFNTVWSISEKYFPWPSG